MLRLHSENGFARIGDDAEHLTTIMMFGRIAIALGETDAAAQLYDALRPFAGMWVVDGIGAVCWGPVELELARLAAALGRDDAAAAHLVKADAAITAAGAPLLESEVAELRTRRGEPQVDTIGESPNPLNQWLREGDFWTLSYAGRTVRIKHAKGIADLKALLPCPVTRSTSPTSTAAMPQTALRRAISGRCSTRPRVRRTDNESGNWRPSWRLRRRSRTSGVPSSCASSGTSS